MSEDQPRQRPTHTVIVTGVHPMLRYARALAYAHCTFTVEYRDFNTWHLGVFADGLRIVVVMADRARD